MFAEELSSNASRKRQQENRARRRQLKTEKENQAARKITAEISFEAPAASSSAVPSIPMVSGSIATTVAAPPPESAAVSAESSGGKPAAVANALQQRQLRQANQLQEKSSIKIQSFFRSIRSNIQLRDHHSTLLTKRLSDLSTLHNILKEKTPDNPFVPPPATTAALVQQVMFLTKPFPYKRKSVEAIGVSLQIKIRSNDHILRLREVLEFTVIPGLQSQDDDLNPILVWLESSYGRFRLEHFLRLCLHAATTKGVSLKCLSTIITFIRILLAVENQQPMSKKAQAVITPYCRSFLIHPTPSPANGTSFNATTSVSKSSDPSNTSPAATMDLIEILRRFLLFTIGGSLPIPPNSVALREKCITENERYHADALFQLVLETARSIPQERMKLMARFVTDVLTIPLLTWKVSIAHLLVSGSNSNGTMPRVVFVEMIASFVELNKVQLSSGQIGSLLPQVEVPINQCPAMNTQCLLANLIALGRVCSSVNGSDRTKIDYFTASVFFQFLSVLLDAIPLGTLSSRDSSVMWISNKGHHTAVVLSEVILDQCKLLLAESFLRDVFRCAIDSDTLRTDSVLASRTEKDVKHETDLKEAAGAGVTAMAAKEVKIDKKPWLSSKWAGKLKKGVSSFLAGKNENSSNQNRGDGGQGLLMETSSVSMKLASGLSDLTSGKAILANKESDLPAKAASQPYSPVMFFSLCRAYATILARWGGGGKGIVDRENDGNELATSRPEPCAMALLNVLCFGTDIVRTSWGLVQVDKQIMSDIANLQKSSSSVKSITSRPSYLTPNSLAGRGENDGVILLFMFVSCLSHTLIITDDIEIYQMDRPLPVHQIRRCISLLKKVLCRACNVDGSSLDEAKSNPFGLALVTASVRVMRDLYDRSARHPLCVPKLWLVENLMSKEIQNCKSHADYVALLSNPVLRICPFLVSFKRRLKLFERIVTTCRIEVQGENSANPFNTNPLKPGIPVQIMRGRVLEDGLATMNKLGRNLRQRINVQYLNEAGARESGVDAGGLFKDFWTDLCAIAFNPDYALFRVTEDVQNCLYPNPSSGAAHGPETHIVLFEFLGRILGKALYEGITIRPQFSHFFLSFLRGDYNYLHMLPDLSSVDSQLYNNLMFLKTYDGDAEDLCLTFSVATDDFGGNKQVDLIPNGSNVSVTNVNKQRYIGLVAKYYVVDRVREQSVAFTRGLWDVIDKDWLRLFNEPELQVLISGASGDNIDVEDMRANSRYIGGFSGIEPTITRFWKVVASFNSKQRSDLLRFVTSCERPPPLGFASMNPPFTIQRVGIIRDGDRLPTASTCFNTLKLPTYSSEKIMRERLLYAIESGAGFELM